MSESSMGGVWCLKSTIMLSASKLIVKGELYFSASDEVPWRPLVMAVASHMARVSGRQVSYRSCAGCVPVATGKASL